MAELRLDQVEAAFKAVPSEFGAAEPSKGMSPSLMSLDQLELFGNDQEIDLKSYDLWYEKALKGMTDANITGTDWAAEPVANFLNFTTDISNISVLGVTSALGNVIESFSSLEKFKEGLGSIMAAGVQSFLALDEPLVYQQHAEAMGMEPAIKGPGDVADTSVLIPSANANVAEKLGKNMRALSFYGYANTKAFQQRLSENVDHPLLFAAGGAFGSITTSALLASVNPQLAMWAIGGHVGAAQYLEQTARGADFVPALGYGAFIGAGVSQLEKMSISLLFKKYSNRLALAGDSAIVNAVEEFSQSLFESGVEQAFGAEDRTLGEIMKNASFEAALGFIGGGAAGISTVQFAYSRMDKALKKAGLAKPERHQIIMKSIADGSSILETVLREGLGANEDDLDIVNKISSGQMNATEGLAELNKRIMQRQKAKGIDTYLDSDPDALISEQQRIDAAEELAARSQKEGVPLTPDEQAEVDAPQGVVTAAEAVAEAANIVSNFEPSQIIQDENDEYSRLAGGFPEPLANKGYSTKDIDTVVKKVQEGKALTARQTELYKDLITLYQDATGRTVGTPQQANEKLIAELDALTPTVIEKISDTQWQVKNKAGEVLKEFATYEEANAYKEEGAHIGPASEAESGIIKVYVGVPGKKVKTDKPFFATTELSVAEHFAGRSKDDFLSEEGAGTIAELLLDTRKAKIKVISAEEYMTAVFGKSWKRKWEKDTLDTENLDLTQKGNKKIIDQAKSEGFNVVKIEGQYEATPLQDLDSDQYIILDPSVLAGEVQQAKKVESKSLTVAGKELPVELKEGSDGTTITGRFKEDIFIRYKDEEMNRRFGIGVVNSFESSGTTTIFHLRFPGKKYEQEFDSDSFIVLDKKYPDIKTTTDKEYVEITQENERDIPGYVQSGEKSSFDTIDVTAQQSETAAPTQADEREMKVLREGREAQINQELDLLESEKAAVVKEIVQRKEEDKQPTKALQTKLDKINTEIEALLDEIDLLPTQTREDLAAKIVAVKGKKISALRNLAEVVAARLEKERLTEKFKREAADLKEARNELAKYVRDAFKGREVPKKFITRVAKVTPKTLAKFLAEVDQARLDIVRPALVNQVNRILGRIAPKVQAGKAAGVLKSATLQDVANELIRISKIDAVTARQLLRNKQQTLTNYFNQDGTDNAVAGEIDVDRLNFEMEVIQNLAGLDGKSEEELMASLAYAQQKVALLRAGGKIRQEQLRQQREQERVQAISEMPKKGFTLIPQWLKNFTHFSSYNLSRMLDSLVGVKNVSESVLGKKIKALEEAPRKEASFNFLYLNGLERVAKRIFGIKNNKEYSDWKNDRFKEGGGYDSGDNIEFNNGTVGRLLLAKADVAYWWLVTHDKNGNELPEMVEKFTGENARRALEEAAAESAEDMDEDMEADEEMDEEMDEEAAAPAEVDLSQIKGNAIPLAHWQEMMANFESDQRNVEFVQSQRAFYNTVYSLINPVYRLYMGTDLPRVEDYIPWYRDVGAETEVFSALEDFNDLVQTTPRSTKLRTPGATAAFRQVGDIEVFQYFVQEMAHFNAFALPMKDLISIIRNKEVRAAINKQTGAVELSGGQFKDSDSYKNLRRMADYIMSRGRSMNEFSLGLFNTMRSNVSIAYLGEPSKGIMQTSSMWMALSEKDITWGDWVMAFKEFIDSPAETIKLLESAPMMKFRYRDMMIEMKDAIEHIKTKNKTVSGRLRRFITPKAFYMVRFGNKVGAGISGYVVFRKVFNETGNIHEAFRRFDKHIVDTQQSAIATELSPFQIGQGNRIISQFQSAVIQYARIYTRSWGDVFAGRITVQKFVDSMLVFHVLMPTMRWMLKALIRGGDFDPDELKKDVIIGPLTAGFIIPDILEGIISMAVNAHHFGASSALQTSADKIVKTAQRVKKQLSKVLANDYYDAADLWYDGIELVEEASTVSLPVPGITYDAMQAAIKASQGEMTPMDILSVILGESVESLEFKNKGSNNTSGSLFRR